MESIADVLDTHDVPAEQVAPCLVVLGGFVGDDILPGYVRIIKKNIEIRIPEP